MMKISKRIGWFGLVLLAFVVALVLMLVGSYGGVFIMEGSIDEEAIMKSAGFATVCAHVLLIVSFAIWYHFGCGRPTLKDVKGVFESKTFLVVVLVAVGLYFLTSFVMLALLPFVPSIQEFMELSAEMSGIMITIAAVLLAPFGEELIFRGVIFYYAKKMVADLENRKMAFWIANIVQALAFGILHLNVVQSTYAFIIGLVLGYLAHRYQSIVPTILAHMLINGIGNLLVNPFAENLYELSLLKSPVVCTVGAVICLGVTMVGLRMSKATEN